MVQKGVDPREVLPIPTHSEHDNGPYITTAGLVIARNPNLGRQAKPALQSRLVTVGAAAAFLVFHC